PGPRRFPRVAVRAGRGPGRRGVRRGGRTVRRPRQLHRDLPGRPGRGVLERLRQHHVLHRHHRGTGDRDRRRDGADHAPDVPWAIPSAVSGLLWRWIFQADGAANAVLRQQILWTADGFPAKMAVVIAEVWKTSPFIGLLVLAGLQMIPRDVYEAARVDGAGPLQQFWRITLPLVKPALLVAVLFRMLDVLRMFGLPAVLIGVNQKSVETLTMIAWFEASNLRYGSAAAYATVLFLYIALLAYLFVKLLGADIIGEARQRTRGARQGARRREA